MNPIYRSDSNTEINYDGINRRAEIKVDGAQQKTTSIAMICMPKKESRGALDSIKSFVLKKLTRNWIKVEGGATNSTQFLNISSISKHLGIDRKEVLKLNKEGSLYSKMCTKTEEINTDLEYTNKINDIKQNEIKNNKILNFIHRFIPDEKTPCDFFIFFDPQTKEINFQTRKSNRTFMNSSEVANSHLMKATGYEENGRYYVKINDVRYIQIRDRTIDDEFGDNLRLSIFLCK